jgi:hypothetical protein
MTIPPSTFRRRHPLILLERPSRCARYSAVPLAPAAGQGRGVQSPPVGVGC